MNAGKALVQTLVAHGVDRIFCVPGESYLPVLDAIRDAPIQLVSCRHEGGAGFMALTDAKLTRRPGVAMVSRGPGAANFSIALHLAAQDFVPVVLFVGQVERADRGRGAFQEVDYAQAFGGLCKGAWEVTDGKELAAVCAQAFALACDDLPGPVLISMPEDMLLDEVKDAASPLGRRAAPVMSPGAVREVVELVSGAKRPLLLVGSGIAQQDSGKLVALSEAFRLPVVTEWKQQHLFPNVHPHFAGHMGNSIPKAQLALLSQADVILAVGCLFDDMTTQGYRFPDVKSPSQKIVLVHPARAAFRRVYKADVRVHGDCAAFIDAMLEERPAGNADGRDAWIGELTGYLARFMEWKPVEAPDGIVFGAVMSALNELLPENGIITHDAGNFSAWMHRHLRFRGTQTLIGGIGGAMGLGIPAAIAASLRHPKRKAVCLVGDGGALMTGAELATAVQYGARPLVILSNNASYGTIRAYQQRLYPGRLVGTELRNPDFVAFARSFGAQAWRLDDPSKIREALSQALAADSAALLEVTTSVTHLSAYASAP